MLAKSGPLPTGPGWVAEFKFDGFRLLSTKSADSVQLVTRPGRVATQDFPSIVHGLAAVPGQFVVDGEVCLVNSQGVPDFEGLLDASARRDVSAAFVLYVFDLLWLNGKDLRPLPYRDRKARLRKLLAKAPTVITFVDYIEGQGQAAFDYACELGMEGVVAKRLISPYVSGRSGDWVKVKPPGVHDGWKRPLYRARFGAAKRSRRREGRHQNPLGT